MPSVVPVVQVRDAPGGAFEVKYTFDAMGTEVSPVEVQAALNRGDGYILRDGRVTLLENARETRRTFLNNSDSCDAVLALLADESALDGGIYNVGTAEEISIVDLARRIASFMGIAEPEIGFRGTRSADPPRRLLSVEKIRAKTGWQARVSLDEGLKACIANRLAREDAE